MISNERKHTFLVVLVTFKPFHLSKLTIQEYILVDNSVSSLILLVTSISPLATPGAAGPRDRDRPLIQPEFHRVIGTAVIGA